jgi:hypothetical protein
MKFRIIEKPLFDKWSGEYEQKFLVQKKVLFWWSTVSIHFGLISAEVSLTILVKKAQSRKYKPESKLHMEVEV